MVRRKVLAHRALNAAAWLGVGVATLVAAYSASGACAAAAALLPWR